MKTRKRSTYPTAMLAALASIFILTIGADAPVSAAPTDGARAAIAAQSRTFMEAMERGDARAAAEVFTVNAKLIVSDFDRVVAGRAAIEGFWKSALSNGVKALRLTTIDLDGAGPVFVETGTYQALGAGNADLGRGHYMFAWKKENGVWRIHRDIGSGKPAQTGAAVMDRVGFPRDYRSALKLLNVVAGEKEPSVMTA
ncbi:MAG TPA: nuclear transport factor 2 family protein, partial [Steroidobacteraceae bacterium]|nr:nuclear transport factor 2 family protein [Steroidobacteraceae bacterium]